MFTNPREQTGRKGNKRVVVGYELGELTSQISFCFLGEGEAETVSSIAGTEQYNIPTVLCKRTGVNQWFYGREALKYEKEGDGILVEKLLTLAERGEEVIVEKESYDPAALLTLFVKRSLSLLNLYVSLSQVDALMFTVKNLTPRMVDVLNKVAGGISLKTGHIYFQSYVESFYYYTLYQPAELWKNNVVIYDYTEDLKSITLECNKKTTPQVFFITEQSYPQMRRLVWSSDAQEKERQKQELDRQFTRLAAAELEGALVSTVYLLGDGFKEKWTLEALKVLCRGRRVFQGNNLYSKGACYGALERLVPSEEAKKYVYLGSDKLKANIGMRVLRRGEDSYFAILDGGENWYEAVRDFEIILESGNVIEFMVTPLTGEHVMSRKIVLDGLPQRPDNTSRLKLHVEMSAVDQVTVTVEDMGFGEIFPSSGKGWTQTVTI